jgi:RHS repeat-associated protein
MHFTGQHHDNESGFDHFGARFNTSRWGRFLSPDPKQLNAHLSDPQSLNRYAYVRNNPLLLVDPNGEDFEKAWSDLKTAIGSIFIKITGGGGPGAEVKLGKGKFFHAEAGITTGYSAKVTLGNDDNLIQFSRSVDSGASVSAGKFKAGPGVSIEQTIVTISASDLSVDTKPGIPQVTITGSGAANEKASGSVSNDETSLGVEIGVFLKVGGEVGMSKEGTDAAKDAVTELKDSLTNPGPRPVPKAPGPPCQDNDKGSPCHANNSIKQQ